MPRIDRVGQRWGRLEVIAFDHIGGRRAYWKCKCDCGEETVVIGKNLANGNTRSCGCLYRESRREAARIHGQSTNRRASLTYQSWSMAKQRCTNPKRKDWPDYGARGIEFRFPSVLDLIADIGERTAANLSLDRIDNDGHYEPGNVRWATSSEQSLNRRDRPRGPNGQYL